MDEVLIKSSILSCKDMGPRPATGSRLFFRRMAPPCLLLPPSPILSNRHIYLLPRDRECAIVLLLLLRQVVIGAP